MAERLKNVSSVRPDDNIPRPDQVRTIREYSTILFLAGCGARRLHHITRFVGFRELASGFSSLPEEPLILLGNAIRVDWAD